MIKYFFLNNLYSNSKMKDNIGVLLTLSLLALVGFKFFGKNVKEHFGMLPPRTVKVEKVVQSAPNAGFIQAPAHYQSNLRPRQGAGMVQYGTNIRSNFPDPKNMGANFSKLVNANAPIKERYGNNDHQRLLNAKDMLPVSNMKGALPGADVQPIVYDRYIFANGRSKYRAGGDKFRGDLPIVPIKDGWFRPSVDPHIDLAQGATAVMGGIDNNTAKKLMALTHASSGGYQNTGSGVQFESKRGSGISSSAMGGDIQVTAFR